MPTLHAAYRNADLYSRSYILEADDVFALFCRVAAELESIYIILGGLDECTEIPAVIKWLLDATSLIQLLRLIILSRDILEIRRGLTGSPLLDLTVDSMKPDIKMYLAKAVLSLPCNIQEMKTHVLNVLSCKAHGMFLYAVLSLQTLQQASNIDETLGIVENTPTGIYNVYRMVLERLNSESCRRRCLAYKALTIISTSTRLLAWPELRTALSWNTDL